MNPATITALAGLVTALAALVKAFHHSHDAPDQPPRESEHRHEKPTARPT